MLDRWLADAAGLTLRYEEIETFSGTATALDRTLAIEEEIDPCFEEVERPAARAAVAI